MIKSEFILLVLCLRAIMVFSLIVFLYNTTVFFISPFVIKSIRCLFEIIPLYLSSLLNDLLDCSNAAEHLILYQAIFS